jgi:predicted DNA-binding protein
MANIVLNQEAERGLSALRNLTGRSDPELIGEAIARYLEDIEDAREAEAECRRIDAGEESTISLEEFLRDDLAR